MKIILKDFDYKGQHYDRFECEVPKAMVVGHEDRIPQYVIDCLDEVISFEEES